MLSRRLICLMCLVLIIVLAGNVQASTDYVDDGSGLWNDAANWTNGIPTLTEWAKISNASGSGHQTAIINSGYDAVSLKTHVGYSGGGTLTINGGTLTMPDASNCDLLLGKSGGAGTLNMNSGTINIGRDLEVAGGATGTINMTGGTINVGEDFMIPEVAGSTAEVHLDGGTIIVDGSLTMGATGSLDIQDGELRLDGDQTSVVQTYYNNGWITGFDRTGIIVWDTTSNPGYTTVTATQPVDPPEKATNPTPADGGEGSLVADLSWTSGTGAVTHRIHFGTTNPPAFQVEQNAATYDPGMLVEGQIYYWQIDEKNDLGTTTGDIWSFTARLINVTVEIEPTGNDDSSLIQTTLDGLQPGDTIQLNGHFTIANTIYLPSNLIWVLNGSLTLDDNASLDDVGWVATGIDATRATGITEQSGGATNIDMSGGAYYGNSANNS